MRRRSSERGTRNAEGSPVEAPRSAFRVPSGKWLAALLTIAHAGLVHAQGTADAPQAEPPSQALPLFLGILFTLLVLWIVCMPSRKQ
jgi:hypothetical protein